METKDDYADLLTARVHECKDMCTDSPLPCVGQLDTLLKTYVAHPVVSWDDLKELWNCAARFFPYSRCIIENLADIMAEQENNDLVGLNSLWTYIYRTAGMRDTTATLVVRLLSSKAVSIRDKTLTEMFDYLRDLKESVWDTFRKQLLASGIQRPIVRALASEAKTVPIIIISLIAPYSEADAWPFVLVGICEALRTRVEMITSEPGHLSELVLSLCSHLANCGDRTLHALVDTGLVELLLEKRPWPTVNVFLRSPLGRSRFEHAGGLALVLQGLKIPSNVDLVPLAIACRRLALSETSKKALLEANAVNLLMTHYRQLPWGVDERSRIVFALACLEDSDRVRTIILHCIESVETPRIRVNDLYDHGDLIYSMSPVIQCLGLWCLSAFLCGYRTPDDILPLVLDEAQARTVELLVSSSDHRVVCLACKVLSQLTRYPRAYRALIDAGVFEKLLLLSREATEKNREPEAITSLTNTVVCLLCNSSFTIEKSPPLPGTLRHLVEQRVLEQVDQENAAEFIEYAYAMHHLHRLRVCCLATLAFAGLDKQTWLKSPKDFLPGLSSPYAREIRTDVAFLSVLIYFSHLIHL